jgi:hypothetical protein
MKQGVCALHIRQSMPDMCCSGVQELNPCVFTCLLHVAYWVKPGILEVASLSICRNRGAVARHTALQVPFTSPSWRGSTSALTSGHCQWGAAVHGRDAAQVGAATYCVPASDSAQGGGGLWGSDVHERCCAGGQSGVL